MKIALLITGQLRTVDMVKILHMNSIIKKYDTDVFLGIDLNNSKQCLYKNNTSNTNLEKANEIISFFNPKSYFICDDYSSEFKKLLDGKSAIFENINYIVENHFMLLFEQYYIVKQTYNLLLEHINKTNTKYDIIIRLRFDQFIWTDETHSLIHSINKTDDNQIIYDTENTNLLNTLSESQTINFQLFDNTNLLTKYEDKIDIVKNKLYKKSNKKNIYLLGFGDCAHYKYANDQFWYHKPKLINVISSFYDNMYKLMYKAMKNKTGDCGCMIEHLWHTYLVNNKINIHKGSVSGVFVREYL
jgi:hypothetical protein